MPAYKPFELYLKKLFSLTQDEILNYLPDILDSNALVETIQEYLQSNINIYEQLSGIFIYNDSNVSYKVKSEEKNHQLYNNLTENNACFQAYSTALYAYNIQQQLANVFVGKVHIATWIWSMIEEGFRCKVSKLNELSSRRMEPHVLKSITMQPTKSKINCKQHYSMYTKSSGLWKLQSNQITANRKHA